MAEHETHGDETEIACPWCGENMWLADDARWASSGDECEHCERPFTLTHDVSVDTTAQRGGDAVKGPSDG